MEIASIMGARPQFVKCTLLFRELRKENEKILIHMGRHFKVLEDRWKALMEAGRENIIKALNKFKPQDKQKYLFGCGNTSIRIRDILRVLG